MYKTYFLSQIIRGHTDAIILSLLVRQDNYGYNINKNITEVSGWHEL